VKDEMHQEGEMASLPANGQIVNDKTTVTAGDKRSRSQDNSVAKKQQ
jgi:hypothetical protein